MDLAMSRVKVGVSAPQYRGCQKVGIADPALADGDSCAVLCNPISAVGVDRCDHWRRHANGILPGTFCRYSKRTGEAFLIKPTRMREGHISDASLQKTVTGRVF